MDAYIKRRASAATAGVAIALLTLLGGLAGSSRAASPPSASLASLSLRKVESKLGSVTTSLVKLNKLLPKTYLKITSANSTFLKISDANAQFLKISDADQRYLPASAANSFIQGNGNVVSGTLSNLTTSPQQLLTLAGGTFALKVTDVPGAGRVIAIHNATPNTLGGAADMGDGLASSAFTLTPNADTQLPAVQANAAEIRLQIFPGGTFTGVVSILIGLTPVPGTSQVEAVAQAFTGGV